jgi:hypothetical protein
LDGGLNASTLIDMVEVAQEIASENLKNINYLLKGEEQRQLQSIEPLGFR